MNDKQTDMPATPPEQVIYANLLLIGVWLGLLLLFVTYTLYLTGALSPHIPISEVPSKWGMGVDQYLHETGTPQGWGWTTMLNRGDFLNYIGFAFLALTTVFCYLVLMGSYIRNKDRLYLTICALEIAVLVVAASGVLGSGGH